MRRWDPTETDSPLGEPSGVSSAGSINKTVRMLGGAPTRNVELYSEWILIRSNCIECYSFYTLIISSGVLIHQQLKICIHLSLFSVPLSSIFCECKFAPSKGDKALLIFDKWRMTARTFVRLFTFFRRNGRILANLNRFG